MFGKGKSKKQTLDMDLDLDMNFDDLGMGDMNTGSDLNTAKNRKPIERFSKGVLSGAKDEVLSTRTIRNGIKNALPRGYGSALDLGDDVIGKLSSAYMDASKELAPVIKETKKAITKLMPKEAGYLPKSVQDKINGWRDDDKYSQTTSEANAREDSIGASLGDIFKTSIQQAESHKSEERVQGHIRDQMENRRHTQMFDVSARTFTHIQSIDNYNKSINLGFQKKSLELQYRSLFALQDILKNTVETSRSHAEKLEAIRHNTALPDFVKSNSKEFRDQILKQELIKAVQDGLYGGLKNKLTTISKNGSDMLKNAAKSFASNAVGSIQQGMMMHEMASQGGMDMVNMAGQGAGGWGAGFGLEQGFKWLGKKIGSSKHAAKINKYGHKLQYIADNKDEILQDILDGKAGFFKNNSFEEHRKRDDIIREQQQRLEWIDTGILDKKDYTGFDELYVNGNTFQRAYIKSKLYAASISNNLKHGAANKGRDLFSGAGKSSFKLNTKDMMGAGGSVRDMSGPYPFTRQTDLSINRVIPGYLALILKEINWQRTGKEGKLHQYNPISGKIDNKDSLSSSIKKMIGNDIEKEKFNNTLATSIKYLDKDDTLKGNDAAIETLKDILLEHGTTGNTLETFLKSKEYKEIVGKHYKVLNPILKAMSEKNDGDGIDRKMFNDSIRTMTNSIKNPSAEIEEMIKMGHGDTLIKMGLVTVTDDSSGHKEYKLNDKAIKAHFRDKQASSIIQDIKNGFSIKGKRKSFKPNANNPFNSNMNQGGIVRHYAIGGPVISSAPNGQDSGNAQLAIGKDVKLAGGEYVVTAKDTAILGGAAGIKKLLDDNVANAKKLMMGGVADVKGSIHNELNRPANKELLTAGKRIFNNVKDTVANEKMAKARATAVALKIDLKTINELDAFLSLPIDEQLTQFKIGFKNSKLKKLIPDIETIKGFSNSNETLGSFISNMKARAQNKYGDMYRSAGININKQYAQASARAMGYLNKDGKVDALDRSLRKQHAKAMKMGANAKEKFDNSATGKFYHGEIGSRLNAVADYGKAAGTTTIEMIHAQMLKARENNPGMFVPSLVELKEKIASMSPADAKKYIIDLRSSTKDYIVNSRIGEKFTGKVADFKAKLADGKEVFNSVADLYKPTDIYCKDETGRLEFIPRLYKTKMLQGLYYCNGKVVAMPGDIKGEVRDITDHTNIAISEEDLKNGIFNSEGRPIGNKVSKLFGKLKAPKGYKLGIIPKALLAVLKPFKWAIKTSMKTAPWMFKQYGKIGSKLLSMTGNLFFSKVTDEKEALAAHTASATNTLVKQTDATNEILSTIHADLTKPKEDPALDKDGNRVGSWKEQMNDIAAKRKDALLKGGKDKLDKGKSAISEFFKNLGAKMGGMVMTLAAPILAGFNKIKNGLIGSIIGMLTNKSSLLNMGLDALGIFKGKLGGIGKIAGTAGEFLGKHMGALKGSAGRALGGIGSKLGGTAVKVGGEAMGMAGAAGSALKGALSLKGGLIGAAAGLATNYALDKGIEHFGKDKYGNTNDTTVGLMKVGKTAASWAAWGSMLGPWGAAAGGAAGAAYGMYENWGQIFGKKTKRAPSLTGIRYAQYGFNFDNDKTSLAKVLHMEDILSSHVKEVDGHADLDDEKIDMGSLMVPFGLDATDEQSANMFKQWYQERFRPIFVAHLTICKSITKGFKLAELGKLRGKDKRTALEAVKGLSKAYSVHWVPVPDISKYKMSTKSDINDLIDDAMAAAKLEKGGADAPGFISKGASALGKGIVTLAGFKAGDGVFTKAIKIASIMNPIGLVAKGIGALFKLGSTGAGYDADARGKGVNALEAIRMKAYGLKDLDASKVKALKQLEKTIAAELTYGTFGSGANWTGDIHKVIDNIGPLFGVTNNTDSKFSLQWLWWFTKRFLPVFLQYADGVRKFISADPTNIPANALKVQEMLDISDMILATSGIWKIDYTPFEGMATNNDPTSVKDNVAFLKNNIKEDKVRQEAAKLKVASPNKNKPGVDNKPKPMAITTKAFNGEPAPKGGTITGGGTGGGSIGDTSIAAGELLNGGNADAYISYEKKDVTINGLQPAFAKLLRGAIEEYGTTTGKKIQINSGFRTYKQQEAEYNADPTKAARPGSSPHEFGLAVDINTADLDAMDKLGILRKYGLTRPVGAESWHLEPAGIQLDPVGARDPSVAADAIVAGIGKGGGGWGTMTKDGDLHTRNTAVAKQLLAAASTPIDTKARDKFATDNKSTKITDQAAADNKITAATTTDKGNLSTGVSPSGTSRNPNIINAAFSGEPRPTGSSSGSSALAGLNSSGNINGGSTSPSMPGTSIPDPVDGNVASVQAAIKAAAKLVGVDENIGLAISAIESDFKNVRATGASSNGYMQITDGTFSDLMKKYGSKYGLDPGATSSDGKANIILGMQYIKDNMAALGGSKSVVAVYLTYFLGPSGAAKFMKNYAANPNAIAATDFPGPSKANPGIFFSGGGKGPARTYADIVAELGKRFAAKTSKYGIPYTGETGPTQTAGATSRGQSVNPNTGAVLSGPQVTNTAFAGGPTARPTSTPVAKATSAYSDNPTYKTTSSIAQPVSNQSAGSASSTDSILTEQLSVLKAILNAVKSGGGTGTKADDDKSPATASADASKAQMSPAYKPPETVVSMARMSAGTYGQSA